MTPSDTQLDKILELIELGRENQCDYKAETDEHGRTVCYFCGERAWHPFHKVKEAKQALRDLMLDAVIEELKDLWTSGNSIHRDIRVGYDRGLTVHERITELTAQKGRRG